MNVLITAVVLLIQDKPLTWEQVSSRKLKQYSFTFKGTGEVDGVFENGAVDYQSSGVEAAGKGGITHARIGGTWTSAAVQPPGPDGETLRRLSKLSPPHVWIPQLASAAVRMEGNGSDGFTGEFTHDGLARLMRDPWLNREELANAKDLKGSFALSCADGAVVKAELRIQGTRIETVRRSYAGQPRKGAPPPVPPAPNWKLGPDGYWYEGVDKPVAITALVTLKDVGSARLPDELRTRLGLK